MSTVIIDSFLNPFSDLNGLSYFDLVFPPNFSNFSKQARLGAFLGYLCHLRSSSTLVDIYMQYTILHRKHKIFFIIMAFNKLAFIYLFFYD